MERLGDEIVNVFSCWNKMEEEVSIGGVDEGQNVCVTVS